MNGAKGDLIFGMNPTLCLLFEKSQHVVLGPLRIEVQKMGDQLVEVHRIAGKRSR